MLEESILELVRCKDPEFGDDASSDEACGRDVEGRVPTLNACNDVDDHFLNNSFGFYNNIVVNSTNMHLIYQNIHMCMY